MAARPARTNSLAAARKRSSGVGSTSMMRIQGIAICKEFEIAWLCAALRNPFRCNEGSETQAATLLFYISPTAAVALQKFVCFLGTPFSSRIVRKVARWQGLPDVEHGGDDAPS